MCGIAGYWDVEGADLSTGRAMANAIKHRGPDDSGVWKSLDNSLVFGHQRLAVVDLSAAGHQPMTTPCGRFTLIYNGEIYNHMALRAELLAEGGAFAWRGHSDTETLLAGLLHWGITETLPRLNGMFAFALWDSRERVLFLARDRMGEKPLYYGCVGNSFLFGSELKALKAHPRWAGEIDRNALALFMRHNYVPTPWSIYQGIKKLPAASFIVVRDFGRSISDPNWYWNLEKIATNRDQTEILSAQGAEDQLDVLLRDAVAQRMLADVPLGAFLSGGIDSSLVVALMQQQSAKAIQTFTIGFDEPSHNEAPHAKAIAAHLGTNHSELYVSPEDAMAVIPKLPGIWDEPFSDSSQIPTYLVSAMARQQVTVSLSGDGGDELFYGYGRYASTYRNWRILKAVPQPVRQLLAWLMRRVPGAPLEYLLNILPQRMRIPHLADRMPKLAEVLTQKTGEEYYHRTVSHWKNPSSLVLGSVEPATLFHSKSLAQLESLREKMMYLDSKTYLPDDILTKVDRASMAVGLEARVPLLDHRIVEFSWQLPHALKENNGQGKWILRQLLARYVPRNLVDRPKMGFAVPIEHWLRDPLRDWAEDLLQERHLREQGYFDPAPIRKMWLEHVSGKRRWHSYLWDVLMFQAWLQEN